MDFTQLRKKYHQEICKQVLGLRSGIPNIADVSSKGSVAIAKMLVTKIGYPLSKTPPPGQTAGTLFSSLTMEYLNKSFDLLQHVRPGDWLFSASQAGAGITAFDQYEHIAVLNKLARGNKELAVMLGEDYLITPDIVIGRKPVADPVINAKAKIVSAEIATLTTLRERNLTEPKPILHASIS